MAEKEYIEREAFKAEIRRLSTHYLNEWDTLGVLAAADRIPAANVRPVVLCRDCKWCHAGYCEKYDDLIPFGCANKPWEDWFCADGEKREES